MELIDTGTNTYNGDTDYITGSNPSFPFGSSHFDVANNTGYKKLICRSEMESSQAVSSTVGIRYLTLPWKVQISGGSNIAAGSCDIKVYVPLYDPIASGCPAVDWNKISNCNSGHIGLFEDLLAISCSAAEGASTQTEVFDLMWKDIQTLQLKNLQGEVMQYWGHGASTPNEHDSTASLLREADGTCGDWSSLFVDLLRSQGLNANYTDNTSSFRIGAIPSCDIGYSIYLKKAYYYGNDYPQNSLVCLRQQGTRFQGGGVPNGVNFQDHVINNYNSKLYDATCGKGGYDYSPEGFLQYLRANCYITVNNNTVLTGNDLELDCFLIYDPNLREDD